MKVGLVQFSPLLGDVQKNLDSHLKYIERAKKEGIQLLVFPELSLTGYTLKDLIEEVALDPQSHPIYQELKAASQHISLVFGFVEERGRGLIYNSTAFLSAGKTQHIHRKVFLPTYGMFEEGKFFAQGKSFDTFPTPFGKAGMMICYDFLHYGACYLLSAGGSDIIIAISAAPGRGYSRDDRFDSSQMWELMGETISRFSTVFVIYCNRVGFEDGKPFAGGSFIYGPAGDLQAKGKYVDEDFVVHDMNMDEINSIRKKRFYRRDDRPEILNRALERIIRRHED